MNRNTFSMLGVIALLQASIAFAGFTNFSGNTRPQKENGIGATINFSVLYWDPQSRWDAWGTGTDGFDLSFVPGQDFDGRFSPTLDRRARYLYLYQTVNDGDYEFDVDKTEVARKANRLGKYATITSWGHFRGMSLADDKTQGGTPVPVSYDNTFGPAAPRGGAALLGRVIWPCIVSVSGAERTVDPSWTLLLPRKFVSRWEPNLAHKTRSTLFGFTSNHPPTIDWVKVIKHPNAR